MNVPTYFLIVLGGFAIVWGFRWGRGSTKPLGEFEYAAWSAIWGSVWFYILLSARNHFHWPSDSDFNTFTQFPFLVSPYIAVVGGAISAIAGRIIKVIEKK